jgi:hypothetical protein
MQVTCGTRLLGLSLTVLLGAAAVLFFSARGPSAYLVAREACLLTGSFSANGVYPTTAFPDSQGPGETAFGSWRETRPQTGNFRSPVFRSPALLHFFVAGYPTQEGISLYLEDAQDRRRLALKVSDDPHETWRRLQWTLPGDWRGRHVRLVADDQADARTWWIGITLPREGGAQPPLSRLAHAIACAAFMGAEGLLFVLPGFVVAMLLRRRFALHGLQFTAVAFTAAAVIGYLFFWIYFADVSAGKVASFVLLGASAVAAPLLIRQSRPQSAQALGQFGNMFVLVLLTGWLYLGLGYCYEAGWSPGYQAANQMLVKQQPPDHLLPWVFAERIYGGIPLRPHLLDIWKSSDRPPLQAGITLAQYPLWTVFTRETHYYLLGIFLQSLWAATLWMFLIFAGLPRRVVVIVLALCIPSGFFFTHSFYVWPKLLAANFLLIGLTFSTFNRPDYRWSTFDTLLSGAAIAMSILSHTGVLLAVPGLVWVFYRKCALPARRIAAWCAAAVWMLWLPWLIYQKYYDPPGNLLMKAHLAGSENQERAFGQLLVDAYTRLTAQEWVSGRLANLRVLFVPNESPSIFSADSARRYDAFSQANYYSMFVALGFLNAGLLVRLRMYWLRRRMSKRPEIALADRCVVAALISTVFWCLVMIGPGSTMIHQGSLATVFLLFLGFGIYLAALTPRLACGVAALQLLMLPVFVVGKLLFANPPGTLMAGAIDPGFAVVALLSAGGLLVWASRSSVAYPGDYE